MRATADLETYMVAVERIKEYSEIDTEVKYMLKLLLTAFAHHVLPTQISDITHLVDIKKHFKNKSVNQSIVTE